MKTNGLIGGQELGILSRHKCLGITYLLRRRVGRIPSVRRGRRALDQGRDTPFIGTDTELLRIRIESRHALTTSYLVEGAANERAARLKETQQPAHLTRDADAHSCANVRSRSNRSPKPKRTIDAQVNSVQALVDFQCSRKPSRTSCQICEFVGFAEPFH